MPLISIHQDPVTDSFHGVIVADPYRWLEDGANPQTKDWISRQQERHDAYFSQIPEFEVIKARVREYLDTAVLDTPIRVAQREFYSRRQGAQEQASIFFKDLPNGEEHLLVDPASEGSFTSVAIQCISRDGSLLAYQLKHGGGDSSAIRIVQVATRRVLPDRLEEGYARGFTFTSDNTGFYHCHDRPAGIGRHVIRFHRFGTPPDRDPELFGIARAARTKLILIADNYNLGAFCRREKGSELVSDLYLAERVRDREWKPAYVDRTGLNTPFLKHGRVFVVTDSEASTNQIVELAKNGNQLGVVVPARESDICSILPTDRRIYVGYRFNHRPIVTAWLYSGAYVGTVSLPESGTVNLISAMDDGSDGFFYSHESFASPRAIFEYMPHTGDSVAWSKQSVPIDTGKIAVREVWYQSRDLTPIPMSLVMRSGIDLTSGGPVIMTAYGGFGVSMTPQFSVLVSILLERGAIFALPNIRGGGEFGNAWHNAARGTRKQVSFDDFIAAAEWLDTQGLISQRQLAVFGGSHSGLLVAAAMTQRPDLFRAVLCIAPILDMLRYERFGRASKWKDEYGSPTDCANFHALLAYSPYHRIRDDVDYPATLFVTGDQDDRCDPAHVRKMAARLQNRAVQLNPILVDYSRKRGHSPVLPLGVRIDALARRIAFLLNELGLNASKGEPL